MLLHWIFILFYSYLTLWSYGEGKHIKIPKYRPRSIMHIRGDQTNTPNCNFVSVVGDATYCVSKSLGSICSGSGPTPAGTVCPKKNDNSAHACRPYLRSYDSEEHKCIAPVDAKCEKMNNGAWGCIFPKDSVTTPPSTKPTIPSNLHKLKVISYNDVYVLEQVKENGYGLGGASRVAKYIHDIKKNDPDTLVLFAGDTMSPSLWSRVFHGLQMVDAHNNLLVDYASLGNHEFDMGLEAFYKVSQKSNFPWLNANCYEIKSGKLLPHTIPNAIKEINNMKVGFFGVMYDMQDNSTGAYWTDPIEAGKEQVKLLKEQGAEFIIALTHQDWEDDNVFSSEVEGVDLILGGHDHRAMMQTDFGTPYLKADLDFKSIWVSDIKHYKEKTNAKGKKIKPTTFMKSSKIPITEDLPTDKHMDQIIENYAKEVNTKYGEPVGDSCEELDARQITVRVKENKLGNMLADAMRVAQRDRKADFSIMNGGGIRSDKIWSAGVITWGTILSWCPFGNYIGMVRLSGKALKEMLETDLKESCTTGGALQQNGMLPIPSGFEYEYQCTDSSEGKLTRIQYPNSNGKLIDLEDEKRFTLSSNEYVLNRHKNILKADKAKILVDEKEALSDDLVVINYIEKHKEVCPKLENRMKLHSLSKKLD